LAIGTTDSNVRFLQGYPPFGVAKTFDGFVGTEIIGIDFSPDLNHFIVCGGNSVGKLTLFNILSNGTWVNTTQNLVPASAIAKDCRFSYFNNRIIVNTATKLFIFDLTFSVIDNYNTPSVIYEKVAPDPISNLVEYIDSNHDILYDLNLTNRISTALVGNTNVLRTIDISSTGNYIASGGDDALVYIYNSDR
jgi:WD40 repeat protein